MQKARQSYLNTKATFIISSSLAKKGSHLYVDTPCRPSLLSSPSTFTKPLSGTQPADPEFRIPNPGWEPLFAGVLVYLTWLMKLEKESCKPSFLLANSLSYVKEIRLKRVQKI